MRNKLEKNIFNISYFLNDLKNLDKTVQIWENDLFYIYILYWNF